MLMEWLAKWYRRDWRMGSDDKQQTFCADVIAWLRDSQVLHCLSVIPLVSKCQTVNIAQKTQESHRVF